MKNKKVKKVESSKLLRFITQSKHLTAWVAILVTMSASVLGIQFTQLNLQTSLLDVPAIPSFDGTVYPLPQVPLWHKLTTTEYSASFDLIPSAKLSAMPFYNPNLLQASLTGIGYSDADNQLRNTKITYPVPYLGSYKFDGLEYAGSHPAVDIKAPAGTPVVAIANGVVSKVGNDVNGFGHFVVIKHINVPQEAGGTATLYSSYSHLSSVLITEGQTIYRGDRLGLVGRTGTATTNHLHFQIDKDSAPWHPYWPFSYKDYKDLGISFFEAINKGVGQENAIAHTINPMVFVQNHLTSNSPNRIKDVDPVVVIPDLNKDEVVDTLSTEGNVVNVTPVVPVVENVVVSEPAPVESPRNSFDALNYSILIASSPSMVSGGSMQFDLTLIDENGNVVLSPEFVEDLHIEIDNSNIASLQRAKLSSSDFVNGHATVGVNAIDEGEFSLRVPVSGSVFESTKVSIMNDVKEVRGFKIVHDGNFIPNQPEEVKIYPIDEDGNVTAYTILGEVVVGFTRGDLRISEYKLNISDFANGYAVLKITPISKETVVIKAKHSFIKGESEPLEYGEALFSDLPISHPNYKAVSSLKRDGVISGYPDGTFKPSKGVSRVEVLKLIFSALKSDVPSANNLTFSFKDTNRSEWYAPFLEFAIASNIVKGYSDNTFKPSQTVNKAEFAKMLVIALNENIDESPSDLPSDVSSSDWFAPYVAFVVENGYADLVNGKFYPNDAMDRAKVAESLYRVVQD